MIDACARILHGNASASADGSSALGLRRSGALLDHVLQRTHVRRDLGYHGTFLQPRVGSHVHRSPGGPTSALAGVPCATAMTNASLMGPQLPAPTELLAVLG